MPFLHTLTFLSTLAVAFAVTPTAPGPGDTFPSTGNCTICWASDSTGSWSNMTINLMSGSNAAQTIVQKVAVLDGTDASLSPYNWTCPEVTTYSAIYFYEFINNVETPEYAWTTRFTITSPTGESTPPEHSTQPNGDAIPWGTGNLTSTYAESSINSTDTQPSSNSTSDDSAIVAPLPIPASMPTATPSKKYHSATPTLGLPQDNTLDNSFDSGKQVQFDDAPARAQSSDDDTSSNAESPPTTTRRSHKGMKTIMSAAPTPTDETSDEDDDAEPYAEEHTRATHPHAIPTSGSSSSSTEGRQRAADMAGERRVASSGASQMTWSGMGLVIGFGTGLCAYGVL